jgi:hypothetical protein
MYFRDPNANNNGNWNCDIIGCLHDVKNLDILSVHLYGSSFAARMAKAESYAYDAGKAFMVDEYGKRFSYTWIGDFSKNC